MCHHFIIISHTSGKISFIKGSFRDPLTIPAICTHSPVSAACVGNVAGVVSLPTPGTLGLAARVRDQGGGGGQRPGRVPPLGEDEEAAAAELLLHCVHCDLEPGVREVTESEGGIHQLSPGTCHPLLRWNYKMSAFLDVSKNLINIGHQSDEGLHHEPQKNENCVLK